MASEQRKQEILDELQEILSGIEAACHPDTLKSLDVRLSKICDNDNEIINEDEEIGPLLDMIFEKFDEKDVVIKELDKFMVEQLGWLTAGEDE